MTMIDPLNVLRQMPPGSALYSRELLSDRWEVAWLIREETKRINQLGKNPEVEFRAGIYEYDGVMLIPVLVRIGPETRESVYETWINIYQDGDGFKYLNDLFLQDRIVVHLYGNDCTLERSLVVSNQLQGFITAIIGLIEEIPPWPMSAFDAARKKLYNRYPDVLSLWNTFKKTS